MIERLKNLFVSFVIISLLGTAISCKKETKETTGTSILTVQTVIGDVTIKSGDAINTPAAGSAIKENSIINTGKLSLIDIKYKNSGRPQR